MFLILLSSNESHQTNLSCFDEPNNVGLGWLYVLAWVEIIVIECISSLLNSRLKWTSIDKYRYFLFQDVGYYIEYQLGMSDSIFSKQLPAQTWSEKQRPKCGLSAPIQTEFLNENSKIPTLNSIVFLNIVFLLLLLLPPKLYSSYFSIVSHNDASFNFIANISIFGAFTEKSLPTYNQVLLHILVSYMS